MEFSTEDLRTWVARQTRVIPTHMATIHYRLGQALFRGGANEGAKKEFAEFERLHAQETADTGK